MSASLNELPTLLTPPELARLLRTTTNSLAQDRYLGRGVPFVRHGRKVLYARADVSAYLEGNRCQRTDDVRGDLDRQAAVSARLAALNGGNDAT